MKFVYLGLVFIMVTVSTRGNSLSKKITDLLQEVIDESKKSDQSDDLDEIEEDKDIQMTKKEINAPNHRGKLPHRVTDILEDVVDESNTVNHTTSEDMDGIKDDKPLKNIQKTKKYPLRERQLSKKMKALLKQVLAESKRDDETDYLDETKDDSSENVQIIKKETNHPSQRGQLSRKITDLLQDVVDGNSIDNQTVYQDEIQEGKPANKHVQKMRKDHPNQCAGSAFDKAVDNIAEIVKEGIMDKLIEDFNHKFDKNEEEVYKKLSKDSASPNPWVRRRHWRRRW